MASRCTLVRSTGEAANCGVGARVITSDVCAFRRTEENDGGEIVRVSGLRGPPFSTDCAVRGVCR